MTARPELERRALARTYSDFCLLREQADGLELPEIALVAVDRATEDITLDAAAFNRRRGTLDRPEGAAWCRFRSVVRWSGAADWPSFKEAGPPLFAEWIEAPERSCRLRLLSGSASPRARIWTFTERVLGPDDPLREGEVCALREERKALARAAPDGIASLVYHVFWGAEPHEDVHALRRRFDRFAGFLRRSEPCR
jgi:hypothetical protein